MRILHTSDWHLGQYFHGKSRLAEHQAFGAWLVEQVKKHDVDLVIVAGDIFDTASPPSYARECYHEILSSLHDAGCQTAVLAGNHDSVAVLNETADLLQRFGTTVVTTATEELAQQLSVLKASNGEPLAILCAVPFIRPRDVLKSEAGQSGKDRQMALQNAIVDHYQRLHEQALALRSQSGCAIPIIATGHLTVVGIEKEKSESVRDIYIGSLEALPVNALPDADYIALGHIHRSYAVGQLPHIRYSGSPIPLSFDELDRAKSVTLVDFDGQDISRTQRLNIPLSQALFTLKGSAKDILSQLKKLGPSLDESQSAWLSLDITSADYPPEIRRAIEDTTETFPMEILLQRRHRTQAQIKASENTIERLQELTPGDVFERRLAQVDIDDAERLGRIKGCFQQVLDSLELKQAPEPRDSEDAPQQGSLL